MFIFFFFFFSSRRRHTRYIGDWSSDVCSSDLARLGRRAHEHLAAPTGGIGAGGVEELTRSEERRVGKGVDLGGRRIIKKKKKRKIERTGVKTKSIIKNKNTREYKKYL